jgi:hypothetical protein
MAKHHSHTRLLGRQSWVGIQACQLSSLILLYFGFCPNHRGRLFATFSNFEGEDIKITVLLFALCRVKEEKNQQAPMM